MEANMVSDELKQELLERYRDINVDYDWWDSIYDDFKVDMDIKGIHVDKMYFSGFWSQGDGACFEGVVFVNQFAKFMEVHDLCERYPAAKFFADQSELCVQIAKESHHYCHENTVNVYLRDSTGNPYDDFTPRWEIYDTMQTLLDSEYAALELDCEEIIKGYMQELYSRLQKEYEYLTSEEVVWESIVANELHLEAA
jgi:hypothetical protein